MTCLRSGKPGIRRGRCVKRRSGRYSLDCGNGSKQIPFAKYRSLCCYVLESRIRALKCTVDRDLATGLRPRDHPIQFFLNQSQTPEFVQIRELPGVDRNPVSLNPVLDALPAHVDGCHWRIHDERKLVGGRCGFLDLRSDPFAVNRSET